MLKASCEVLDYKVKAKAALYPLIISQLKFDGHIYLATELERLYATLTRVNPTNSLLDLITSHLAQFLGEKDIINVQWNEEKNSPRVARPTKMQDNSTQYNTSDPLGESNKEKAQTIPDQILGPHKPKTEIENSHLDILDSSLTLPSTWAHQRQLSPDPEAVENNESTTLSIRGDCKSGDSSREDSRLLNSGNEGGDASLDGFHSQVGITLFKQDGTPKQDRTQLKPETPDDLTMILSSMMITNTSKTSPVTYDVGKSSMLITNTPKTSPVTYDAGKSSMLITNTPKTSPVMYDVGKSSMLITNTPKTSPVMYDVGKSSMLIANTPKTSPVTYDVGKSGMLITNTPKTSPVTYDIGKSSMLITNTPKTSPMTYDLIDPGDFSNVNCHQTLQHKWEQMSFGNSMKDTNERALFIFSQSNKNYNSIQANIMNNHIQHEVNTSWNPILDREKIGVIGEKKVVKKPSILDLSEDEKFIVIREIGMGGEINIVKSNIQELVPRTGYFSFDDVLMSVFGKSAPYSVRYDKGDKVDKMTIGLCSFYTPLLMEIVGGNVTTVLNSKLKGNILFPSESYIIAYFGDKWRRFPDVKQTIQFICGADLSGYTPLDVAYGMFGDCWCKELRFKMNCQNVLEMSLDPRGNNRLLRSSP